MVDVASSAGGLRLPDRQIPTIASTLLFRAKVAAFQALRLGQDFARPLPRLAQGDRADYPLVVAESVTPLWSDTRPEEAGFQVGKVQNLRCATAALNGLAIPAGGVFSFWRAIGRTTRRRGYVAGRMLQEGCLVGSVGGGLCQLSNALYEVAQKSGAEIVERHPHSRIVPGSAAKAGRDATVAWNYVDFRFRARQPLLLEAMLTERTLVVRLRSATPVGFAAPEASETSAPALPTAHTCATCGETSCHRYERPRQTIGRAAFLLDEAWPEFRRYVDERKTSKDVLAIPLDGMRWNKPRYGWTTDGYARVHTATVTTLIRGFLARRAARSPGRRVATQLRGAEKLAACLAASLTPDVTVVCVSQSLLPFVWRSGHLGGRRFSVLMTRLPMAELQRRLDEAAKQHPGEATLTDYRAPAWLVDAETEALAAATEIVTPHSEIAAMFGTRATLLEWDMPAGSHVAITHDGRRRIAFPGPAIARKGAAAVRDAARALGLEVVLIGNDLTRPGFWDGVTVRHVAAGETAWLGAVAAAVQPAIVEDRPSVLLGALAGGRPVIASPACGLDARPGVTLVPADDSEALTAALKGIFADAPSTALRAVPLPR